MQDRFGKAASSDYVSGGLQPVAAYPLEASEPEQIELVERALWIAAITLKFYTPSNPDQVSHSITQQNDESSPDMFLRTTRSRGYGAQALRVGGR